MFILKKEIDQLPNRSPDVAEAVMVAPPHHSRRLTSRTDSGFVDNLHESSTNYKHTFDTVSERSQPCPIDLPSAKEVDVDILGASTACNNPPSNNCDTEGLSSVLRRQPGKREKAENQSVQRLSLNCEDVQEQRDVISAIAPRISAVIQAFYSVCSSQTQHW